MKKFKINSLIVIIIIITTILLLFQLCRSSNFTDVSVLEYEQTGLNISDENSNGIWDDIEPFIKEHSTNEYIKLALEQYFKKLQNAIEYPDTEGSRFQANPKDASKAQACFAKIKSKYLLKIGISEIQNAIVNNTARTKAYLKYNDALSGGIYPSWNEADSGNPCDFEVN